MSQGARTLVIVAAILCAGVIVGLLARPEPAPTQPARPPIVMPTATLAGCMAQVPNPAYQTNSFAPETVPVAGHYNGTVCVPN